MPYGEHSHMRVPIFRGSSANAFLRLLCHQYTKTLVTHELAYTPTLAISPSRQSGQLLRVQPWENFSYPIPALGCNASTVHIYLMPSNCKEPSCEPGPNSFFLHHLSIPKGQRCGLRETYSAARGGAMGVGAACSRSSPAHSGRAQLQSGVHYLHWTTIAAVYVNRMARWISVLLHNKLSPNLATSIHYLSWFLRVRNRGIA